VIDVAAHTREEVRRLCDEASGRGERLCGELVVRSRDGGILFADGYVVPEARGAIDPTAIALVAAASVAAFACTPAPPPVPALVAPPPASPIPERAPAPAAPPPRVEVAREPEAPVAESAAEPDGEDVPIVITPVATARPASPKPPPKGAPPRKKPGHEVFKGDMTY
jgi:hypothetical protein